MIFHLDSCRQIIRYQIHVRLGTHINICRWIQCVVVGGDTQHAALRHELN